MKHIDLASSKFNQILNSIVVPLSPQTPRAASFQLDPRLLTDKLSKLQSKCRKIMEDDNPQSTEQVSPIKGCTQSDNSEMLGCKYIQKVLLPAHNNFKCQKKLEKSIFKLQTDLSKSVKSRSKLASTSKKLADSNSHSNKQKNRLQAAKIIYLKEKLNELDEQNKRLKRKDTRSNDLWEQAKALAPRVVQLREQFQMSEKIRKKQKKLIDRLKQQLQRPN